MENKYVTELRIKGDTISVSTLKIIKKYRDDSFFNIKNDVKTGKSFLSCNSVDVEDYENLLKCYEELINENVNVQIIEDGESVDPKLAYNWLHSMHETEEFVNSDDSWIEETD